MKRERFFLCLADFLKILENLEPHLDPLTRSLSQERHNQLICDAQKTLELAADRQEKTEMMLRSLVFLEDKWNEEDNWFQELKQQIPDLSHVSTEKFNLLKDSFQVSFLVLASREPK